MKSQDKPAEVQEAPKESRLSERFRKSSVVAMGASGGLSADEAEEMVEPLANFSQRLIAAAAASPRRR